MGDNNEQEAADLAALNNDDGAIFEATKTATAIRFCIKRQ